MTLSRPRPKKLATTLKPSELLFSCVKNLSCGSRSRAQSQVEWERCTAADLPRCCAAKLACCLRHDPDQMVSMIPGAAPGWYIMYCRPMWLRLQLHGASCCRGHQQQHHQ